MDPAPARYAAVPRPNGMPAQHATEITLDGCCRALEKLTTEGMETHDQCDALVKAARDLLTALEAMSHDLGGDHNVNSRKFMEAVSELQNQVVNLISQARKRAKECLLAAELSEAEEAAMNRDYRPVADATADAGLIAPSSRLHNEN